MMLYTGRDQTPRMDDPARTSTEERRAFSRHIDCDDTGRARPAVNPSATGRDLRDGLQATARRRLDID